MWIFTIMPEWVIHFITGIGFIGLVLAFVLGFVPFIKKYSLPLKIISFLFFVFGAYLEGGLANEAIWQVKIKEVEAQVAKAEAESAKKNTDLQAKLTGQKEVIKEKGDTIIKYVDRYKDREVIKEILKEVPGPERVKIEEVIKFIENCPIPQEIIELHNKAATINKGEKK